MAIFPPTSPAPAPDRINAPTSLADGLQWPQFEQKTQARGITRCTRQNKLSGGSRYCHTGNVILGFSYWAAVHGGELSSARYRVPCWRRTTGRAAVRLRGTPTMSSRNEFA